MAFKERWLQQEGQAVESFLHLEDQKLGRKEIIKLYDCNSIIVDNTDSMLQQMCLFFQECYDKNKSTSLDDKQYFIEQLSLPKLPEHLIFSSEIMANEVLDAIK